MKLLPHWSKYIGYFLLLGVLGFLLVLVFNYKLQSQQPPTVYKEPIAYLTFLGLLVVAFSREVIEDERIQQLRMKSMTLAFIWAIVSSTLRPLLGLMWGDEFQFSHNNCPVFGSLVVYLVVFHFFKVRSR